MKAIDFIRLVNPDKRLSVALAITFAWEVLPVFEVICPDDLRPRKAIELSWRWLAGGDVSREELLAVATAAYAAGNAAAAAAAYAAAYAAANAYAVANAAYWSDRALGNNIIPDLIQGLIPMLIDYAIQNQVKLFTGPGNLDKVFENLSPECRDKVWYNLELFGA